MPVPPSANALPPTGAHWPQRGFPGCRCAPIGGNAPAQSAFVVFRYPGAAEAVDRFVADPDGVGIAAGPPHFQAIVGEGRVGIHFVVAAFHVDDHHLAPVLRMYQRPDFSR